MVKQQLIGGGMGWVGGRGRGQSQRNKNMTLNWEGATGLEPLHILSEKEKDILSRLDAQKS